MKLTEYIVYDKNTDLPVYIGSKYECAEFIGVNVSVISCMVRRTKLGTSYRYDVYNIDKLLKDYDEEKIFGKSVDKD